MATFRSALVALVILAFAPSGVIAAPISGRITVRMQGTFSAALTPGGSVKCSVVLALSPDTTSSTLSIANLGASLLSRSGVQTESAAGVLNSARTSFTCTVPVDYAFVNAVAGQKIIVLADVDGDDPGFFNPITGTFVFPSVRPGHSKQVLTIIDAINQTIILPTATTAYNFRL